MTKTELNSLYTRKGKKGYYQLLGVEYYGAVTEKARRLIGIVTYRKLGKEKEKCVSAEKWEQDFQKAEDVNMIATSVFIGSLLLGLKLFTDKPEEEETAAPENEQATDTEAPKPEKEELYDSRPPCLVVCMDNEEYQIDDALIFHFRHKERGSINIPCKIGAIHQDHSGTTLSLEIDENPYVNEYKEISILEAENLLSHEKDVLGLQPVWTKPGVGAYVSVKSLDGEKRHIHVRKCKPEEGLIRVDGVDKWIPYGSAPGCWQYIC